MFYVDERSGVPIYEQVVWRVKELCLLGTLRPGDQLPSVREMAGTIVANPNTIAKAYHELERQGVIETRPGKGTFVAERVEVRADPRQKALLRVQLRRLLVDAAYAGIGREELGQWLQEELDDLGGDHGA